METRTIKKYKKSLNIIRLGTSGALQKDIKVDSRGNIISFNKYKRGQLEDVGEKTTWKRMNLDE